MCVLMLLAGHFVESKMHDSALLCILFLLAIFQATQGSALFVYITEICDSDSVMGLCLFILMFGLTFQSMFTTCLLNSKLGVNGMFYVLGIVQMIAVVVLSLFMRETKGLSASEKKKLYQYEPKEKNN